LYLILLTAKVCTEHEFFYKGESGGTACSSAYELALDLINTKYDPNMYNIFAFHFSDGDTFGDEDECVEALKKLVTKCNMVGYGEITPNAQPNSNYVWTHFQHSTCTRTMPIISKQKFCNEQLHSKEDVWKTCKSSSRRS
jgi:uncharacterized sporulation protein YeaH/YhbH (DUF444 family)